MSESKNAGKKVGENVKVFIAITVCKILYFIGKQLGKGSSLPGQVALKIYPGVLKKLKLPRNIIAVTGSNGKTSTVELIAHAIKACGMSVGWNHEGSNQIEGVATLLLRISTYSGKVKRDALVLECDERYARKIFEQVKPSTLVATNLCRDQLTRNGHHEFIQDCIRSAIEACQMGDSTNKSTTLVLNADDPYIAALAKTSDIDKVLWFGVNKDAIAVTSTASDLKYDPPTPNPHKYDDGAFCPVCKGRMIYDYRIAAHYGSFNCGICGFSHQSPNFEVTGIDYKTGEITLDVNLGKNLDISFAPTPNSYVKTHLKLPSLVGAYNLASAIAAVTTAEIAVEDAVKSMDNYELKGGRTVRFSIGGHDGILLISKHENSMSYNQNLTWIVQQQKPCTVIVLVDAISRKYYTSDTSWFWDIDFDLLGDDAVKHVVLAGRYVNELAARFALTEVDKNKIGYIADLGGLRKHLEENASGDIFVVTCFADKAKMTKVFDQ